MKKLLMAVILALMFWLAFAPGAYSQDLEAVVNFLAVEVRGDWYLGWRFCHTQKHEICTAWEILPEKFESQEEAYEFSKEVMKDLDKQEKFKIEPLPPKEPTEKILLPGMKSARA